MRVFILSLMILLIPIEVKTVETDLCDFRFSLSNEERENLFSLLRISKAGKSLLNSFEIKYKNLSNLKIGWGSSSFSQVIKSSVVCVQLAKKLPEIEHVADLSHELVHATRLDSKTLRGEQSSVDEFIRARIQNSGGEADAFSIECMVKKEISGNWDSFCSPYVDVESSSGSKINFEKVVDALYSGELAASLTGEAYPQMLANQFGSIRNRRKPALSIEK